MDYKVFVTIDAENELDAFVRYLLLEKRNEQAAGAFLDDFELTKQTLSKVAGSLAYCENPRLKKLGYRRINFISHRYFILYRIEGNTVIIDNIFHQLQDYENKMN